MKKNWIKTVGLIGLLVAVNLAAAWVYVRWDLTQEKRYTISEATKKLLQSLDEQVVVKVYLDGDFPPRFERLERAIRETLELFQAEAGNNLAFRFIEPKDAKLQEELTTKGLSPTNLFASEDGKRTEQLVFPGAIIAYDGKEYPLMLLKGNKADSPDEQLNQSAEGVEFELATAIKRLTKKTKKKIGLLVSHTKVPPPRFSDLIANLQVNYDIAFDINNPPNYDGLDAIIVPKPDMPYSDDDKFKIDQFVMKGGKALFFIDGARVDSVDKIGTFAQPIQLNLDDLFFRYGFRVNQNLIKDFSCAMIPLNVGNMGENTQIKPMPWRFYPIINSFGKHPIVRNLDAVYTRFTSTIDTIASATTIRKTPLLLTSQYTQLRNAPVLVAYNEARQQPDPRDYRSGVQMVALLLEGSFSSLFNNRILPTDPRANGFVANGKPSKVLVCSDGDLIVNDIDYQRNAPYPMGFDRLTRHVFANKDFAMYAIDYLLDAEGLITARNKQVSMRPLDNIKLKEQRLQWQIINLVGPLIFVGLIGIGWYWIRKKRYES
jgi:ABC-2 type transport system permease protein